MTASQIFAQSVPREVEAPPLLKFSFVCFCIFILANYSRFFEWHFVWLHVPLVTSCLALMGAALEGRVMTVFANRVGTCMAVLTLLYAINIPLSSWRGGSLSVFTGDWLKTLMTFVIAGAVLSSFRQCRTALHCIGFGSGVASLLVYLQGGFTGGRLSMSKGTLANANAVAFDLLLGLPFLWLVLTDPHSGKLKKLLAAGLLLTSTVVALQTGSRGGLIGFAVLGVFFFLRASVAGKAVIAFLAIVLVTAGLVLLPTSLKARYATMFAGSNTEAVQEEAMNGGDESAVLSAAARRQLLINSLKLTLTHPAFGVGIGQFATYMARQDNAEGRHSGWQGTHNTYTQISSEAGLPALLAFVCMIFFSVTGVRAVSNRARKLWRPGAPQPEIINVAFAVDAALIVYAVCVCFDYIAYSATLPLLAAISISLIRSGNAELDRAEQAPLQQANPVINLYPVRPPRAMRPAVF